MVITIMSVIKIISFVYLCAKLRAPDKRSLLTSLQLLYSHQITITTYF
jgi:hypothetical protein